MADGSLRQTGPQTWEGTLNGYRVIVSSAGVWHFAILHPQRFTVVCPRCLSLADGGRKARAWVERHPLIARPTG